MTTPTFYPPIIFNLSPTWRVWTRLTAADVHHRLHIPKIYRGRDLYCFLNHPIRYVRIVGMVIALDVYERRTVLVLDDGSGELMEAVVYLPDAELFVRGINIGDIVKARGVVSDYRGRMQMVLKKELQVLRSTAEEIACWQDMVDWKETILVKPWTVCEKEMEKEKRKIRKAQREHRKKKEREQQEYGEEEGRERKKFSGRRRPDGWKNEEDESETEKPQPKRRKRHEPPVRELDDLSEIRPQPEIMIVDDTKTAPPNSPQKSKTHTFGGRRRPEGYKPARPELKEASPCRPPDSRCSKSLPSPIPDQGIPLTVVDDTASALQLVDGPTSYEVKVIDHTTTAKTAQKFSGRRRLQGSVRPHSRSPPPMRQSSRPQPLPPPLPDPPPQGSEQTLGLLAVKTFSGRRRQPTEQSSKPPETKKLPSQRSLKALLREHLVAQDPAVTSVTSLQAAGYPFASAQLLSELAADGYLLPPNSQGEWIVVGLRQLKDAVEKEMRRGIVEERKVWKKVRARGGIWEGAGKDVIGEVVGRICEADGGWIRGAKGWVKSV